MQEGITARTPEVCHRTMPIPGGAEARIDLRAILPLDLGIGFGLRSERSAP